MKRLGIDIDGVLSNFVEAFTKLLPLSVQAKCDLTDPAFPPVWDWDRYYGATPAESDAAWDVINQSGTFWQYLRPRDNAKDDIKALEQAVRSGHDVYYITTRAGRDVKRQTEFWLTMQGAVQPTVIISGHKGLLASAIALDALVDDKPSNLVGLPTECEGFIFDAPYNRYVSDRRRVHTVREALSILEVL